MHGFSCNLTATQLAEIEDWPSHVATYPDAATWEFLTTYTPNFLGLSHASGSLWPESSYGEGVIVGILDTGIWPLSESFQDHGMPAVPRRWKGQCEERFGFKASYCNKKLIGSRFFTRAAEKAAGREQLQSSTSLEFDYANHGTHIASTAAGNFVPGVSYFGYGKGTARGVAPRAHLAMYKVGTYDGPNFLADLMAALDQAIADGVDVISLSTGDGDDQRAYLDPISVGSFSAAEKGIFVAAAAGNGGLTNGAPWITTVGAGTVDRSFSAEIVLSNGVEIVGYSYFPLDINAVDVPLYHCQRKLGCDPIHLNRSLPVAGKFVFFGDVTQEEATVFVVPSLQKSGAFGGLFVDRRPGMFLSEKDAFIIPTIALSEESGEAVRKLIVSSGNSPGPGAAKVQSVRFQLTKHGVKPAPQVASLYSAKGPNHVNPSILKPDILAPGDLILAALTRKFPSLSFGEYQVMADYALMSGTSMAAPHVAGAAALLKAVYPQWTPAAIKSALMTTAYVEDNTGHIITDQVDGNPMSPLEFGAGHIDLSKAMNPGLVYDVAAQDYLDFLCGLNYTRKHIDRIVRHRGWKCSRRLEAENLNYPSLTAIFAVVAGAKVQRRTVTFCREVTNVGEARSVYKSSLKYVPPTMKVKVEPATLSFRRLNETKRFSVYVDVEEHSGNATVAYCFLMWTDQHGHVVSSPIVVSPPPDKKKITV